MKQINVCHKHSDLLKQARERLRTSKVDDGVTTRPRSFVSNKLSTAINSETSPMGQQVEAAPVTSIVYTGEGGRDQKMVGKIVVACSDERGQSNIIIQEVEPRHMMLQQGGKGKKLMRIDLGDMEGYMMAGAQGEDEALEQRLEEELEGTEARLEEELDLQVASESAAEGDLKESPQLKFQLGGEQRGDSEVGKGLGVGGGSTYLQQQREERPIVASLQGVIQTSGIPARLPTSTHAGQSSLTAIQQQGAVIQISEPAAVSDSTTATLGDNMLKIQYKEYDQKILSAEMRPLMSHAELCDTVLVCR